MEIKVIIEAPGLAEAISALAKALTGLNVTQKPAVTVVEKEAPKITLETVRVKLAELNSAGKGAQVKALIAEFDPSDRPKLSNVSADDYAELLEKAAEL